MAGESILNPAIEHRPDITENGVEFLSARRCRCHGSAKSLDRDDFAENLVGDFPHPADENGKLRECSLQGGNGNLLNRWRILFDDADDLSDFVDDALPPRYVGGGCCRNCW